MLPVVRYNSDSYLKIPYPLSVQKAGLRRWLGNCRHDASAQSSYRSTRIPLVTAKAPADRPLAFNLGQQGALKTAPVLSVLRMG